MMGVPVGVELLALVAEVLVELALLELVPVLWASLCADDSALLDVELAAFEQAHRRRALAPARKARLLIILLPSRGSGLTVSS